MGGQHSTDDEHHAGHPEGTTDQRLFAADKINTHEQEDEGRHDLDGAVDAGREQRGIGRADPHRLEDLGRVISNAVRAGELLPEHEGEGEEESIAVALLQNFLPGDAFGRAQFFLQGRADLGDLLLDLLTVRRFVADVRQRHEGFLAAALLHQPAGRLFQEEQANKHQAAGDELDGHGNAPLRGARRDMERHAVVQPVREGAPDDEEFLEQAGDTATGRGWAVLTDEHGGDRGHAPDAETSDHTTAVDHANFVVGPDLDGRTEQEHECEDH